MIYDTVENISEFEKEISLTAHEESSVGHLEEEEKENKKGMVFLKVKTLLSEYLSKAVIIAPGKVPNNLGVENEIKFQNKGVHYCKKCDAPFYQGRTTITVGVGGYLCEIGNIVISYGVQSLSCL